MALTLVLSVHVFCWCLLAVPHSQGWLPMRSNYYFWWNPLMSLFTNNGEYHDYHHQLRGFRFNFAQPYYTFWDQVWPSTTLMCMTAEVWARAKNSPVL
jgi:sterol desaturase/sphingolipid hydroxylase (fatty acid hydroxylase superfamily)